MAARHLVRRASLALLAPARKALPVHCIVSPVYIGSCQNERGSPLLCRHFATRTAADGYLVDLLKSEIEHELHEEASKQGSLKGSPAPFELTDKAGTEEIILSRTFANEQIAVTCLIESAYSDDEDEGSAEDDNSEAVQEDQPAECLRLNVNITKGAETPVLEIECNFFRGASDVTIETVSYLTDLSTDDAKPQPYEGPKFEDLDEGLQRAFHDLLKARGLTPKVATHVMDYLVVKEQREYMRWLHNVETFFSS